MTKRLLAVASNRASTLRVALDRDPLVRAQFVGLATDRECEAASMAHARGIPVTRFDEPDNRAFSDALLELCRREAIDGLVLFFQRLLRGPLLEEYTQRIVNIHPSLLPAFPGLRGFADARAAGARFLGCTFHLVVEEMDAGPVVLQAATPFDWSADEAALRERQFRQMTHGLVQVCHWIEEERIEVADGRALVRGARFEPGEFSPNLELALTFDGEGERDGTLARAGVR